jgi:hypothetical protein
LTARRAVQHGAWRRSTLAGLLYTAHQPLVRALREDSEDGVCGEREIEGRGDGIRWPGLNLDLLDHI